MKEGHGHISQEVAKIKAMNVYQKFNKNQRVFSDFDKEIRRIQGDENEKQK